MQCESRNRTMQWKYELSSGSMSQCKCICSHGNLFNASLINAVLLVGGTSSFNPRVVDTNPKVFYLKKICAHWHVLEMVKKIIVSEPVSIVLQHMTKCNVSSFSQMDCWITSAAVARAKPRVEASLVSLVGVWKRNKNKQDKQSLSHQFFRG